MYSLKKMMMAITLLLSITGFSAQIKNPTTETVKIFGNCEMCKTTIEKAGNVKDVTIVNWNKDTKMATFTYDAKKTNPDEILKRIALAGYDNSNFLAPDIAYSKLPECCHYKREAKTVAKEESKSEMVMANHEGMTVNQKVNQLQPVYDSYFSLKDALVKTDGKVAAASAKELITAISSVKMETLQMEEHMVWMKVLKGLSADSKSISDTQDIKKQRESFKALSKNMYELIKVSTPSDPIFYQYCPMQDANWLSKESTIKNPYYGSQMMTCGKTVETIK
jgi:hypothetical protein